MMNKIQNCPFMIEKVFRNIQTIWATTDLKAALKKYDRDDILVVVGGVIPPHDYEELKRLGAAAIFGPGTVIPNAVIELLELLD
ncbi:MAG: hypothetical protein HRT44_13000 [Bdellovibrionales bacterium]|nr:hypothetical protein [Bdellovibrionales bacterium]